MNSYRQMFREVSILPINKLHLFKVLLAAKNLTLSSEENLSYILDILSELRYQCLVHNSISKLN